MVYPMHFGQGATGLNGTGFQLMITIFMELFGVSIGQLVAALSSTIHIAVIFNPFISIVLALFCGVTIPYPAMSSFWRDWLYQLVPYTRTLSAMLSTELHGLAIVCASDEFNVFNPPANQTCQDWAGDFVSAFGGYLDNPLATTACRYCQYSVCRVRERCVLCGLTGANRSEMNFSYRSILNSTIVGVMRLFCFRTLSSTSS